MSARSKRDVSLRESPQMRTRAHRRCCCHASFGSGWVGTWLDCFKAVLHGVCVWVFVSSSLTDTWRWSVSSPRVGMVRLKAFRSRMHLGRAMQTYFANGLPSDQCSRDRLLWSRCLTWDLQLLLHQSTTVIRRCVVNRIRSVWGGGSFLNLKLDVFSPQFIAEPLKLLYF